MYDNDPDPLDRLERDREREYHRWILNGSDPQDEPEWLEREQEERGYCDHCGEPLGEPDTGQVVYYASLPFNVTSALAGESAQLCVDCDTDLLANDEGCGKWGCKECYPGEDEE